MVLHIVMYVANIYQIKIQKCRCTAIFAEDSKDDSKAAPPICASRQASGGGRGRANPCSVISKSKQVDPSCV